MDFEKARFNMVEQQIRPWDVLDFKLLDVLQSIPRELFVSEEQKPYAYADMALRMPNQSYMLEPKIVARLIQSLNIQENDKVLEVGTGAGYATAIMAKLAKNVVTYDIDAQQSTSAAATLKSLSIENIDYQVADAFQAALKDEQTYQAIYIGAAVHIIPQELCSKLSIGGRLVAISGEDAVQRAQLITRQSETEFSRETLFETQVPMLIQGAKSLGRQAFFF